VKVFPVKATKAYSFLYYTVNIKELLKNIVNIKENSKRYNKMELRINGMNISVTMSPQRQTPLDLMQR